MKPASHQLNAFGRFLEKRRQQAPVDYGVSVSAAEFSAVLMGELAKSYSGKLNAAELLMRPRTAAEYCERIRYLRGWFLPDDLILRALADLDQRPTDRPVHPALADPSCEGVSMATSGFLAAIAEEYSLQYHGAWPFEEFCLVPLESARFCDQIRQRYGWFVLSDEAIMHALRVRAGSATGRQFRKIA